IVRPKPRHVGHAPSGLLKVKSPGVDDRMSRSQCGQCHPVEKGISEAVVAIVSPADFEVAAVTPAAPARRGTTFTFPLPKRSAVSIASVSRALFCSVGAIRSWIT